jgi:uncharacterized protein (DUF885 family)
LGNKHAHRIFALRPIAGRLPGVMRFSILSALALVIAAPAGASSSAELSQVIEDHWAFYLETNPVSATRLGVRIHDDRIDDHSLEAQDRNAAKAKALLDRLAAIAETGLSDAERTNKGVLARLLSEQVEANRFGQRMMLFSTYEGWHQSFADLADRLPF